jgi:hypothetical protein
VKSFDRRDCAVPSRFHRLAAALTAAAFAAPAAAAGPAPSDPTAPVAALYAAEKAGRPGLEGSAVRAATLTRSLAALWAKAKAVERATGDALIDFDVVTNSQGAEIKSYALTVERRDAARATVAAAIDPGDWIRASPQENVIRYALLRQAGRWRIDDVSGVAGPTPWSLRDMLERALRAP